MPTAHLISYEDILMAEWAPRRLHSCRLSSPAPTPLGKWRRPLTLHAVPGRHMAVKLVFQDGLLAERALLELVLGTTFCEPVISETRYFNHLAKITSQVIIISL